MFVVVGSGPDGRSAVVEVREVTGADHPSRTLWTTERLPPELPAARRRADEPVQEARVSATGTRWTLVELVTGRPPHLHRTDTLDYDIVLSGEVTLVLEDGEILLRPGDAVMIPGVVHAWRPGPEGCLLSVVLLGLPPVA